MKRLFWIALGAGAGVYAVREASRAAAKLSPTSMVGGIAAQINGFVADVRIGMREREAQLRADLGLDEAKPAGPSSTVDTNPFDDHPFESRLSNGGI